MTRRETDGEVQYMSYSDINSTLDPGVGAFELYHDMVQGGGMRR